MLLSFSGPFSYEVRNNVRTPSSPAICRWSVLVSKPDTVVWISYVEVSHSPSAQGKEGGPKCYSRGASKDAMMMTMTPMAVMVSMMMELCCEAPFDFATFGTKPPFHRCRSQASLIQGVEEGGIF